MVKTRLLQMRVVLLSVLLVILLPGCVYDPYYSGPPPRTHYYPHPHDYYYYPGVRVYFHFSTGYYYYYDRNRWLRARVLPPHIYIDPRDRVRLRIETAKPYIKHKEHQRKYVPPQKFRYDKHRSLKEREENRKWYKEYEGSKGRGKDREEKRDKNKKY